MSRFYNTSTSTYIDDKMYQLPADLMYNTIMKKDKGVDDYLDFTSTVKDTLKTDNLQSDDPAVIARLKEYEDRITTSTDKVLSKPLDFKREQGNLMRLSRDIDSDLQHGLLGAAQKQFDADKLYNEDLRGRKDVTDEKKQLATKVTNLRYSENKGLNYQKDGSYNSIADYQVALHSDVDTVKLLNEIGTNYQPDKTSEASSNPTGTGYIIDKSENVVSLSEDGVENVVKNRLIHSGWEEERKQYYELLNEINNTDIDVNESIDKERQVIIDDAREKIGYTKKTVTKNTKVDSAYMQRQAKANKNIINNGVIVKERVDPRVYDANNSEGFKKTADKLKKLNDFLIANESELAFSSPKNLLERISNGDIKRKDLNDALYEADISIPAFKAYINDESNVEDWSTPHPLGTDKVNMSYLKSQIASFNSKNPNSPVIQIRVSGSDGKFTTTEYKNIAQVIEDTDKKYVFLKPSKSKDTNSNFKRNPATNQFVDSDGDPIMVNVNGVDTGATTIEQATNLGEEFLSQILPSKSVVTYDTDEVIFKANTTNITQRYNIKLGDSNQISKKLEQRVSNQLTRALRKEDGSIDPLSIEVINLEVIYTPQQ